MIVASGSVLVGNVISKPLSPDVTLTDTDCTASPDVRLGPGHRNRFVTGVCYAGPTHCTVGGILGHRLGGRFVMARN